MDRIIVVTTERPLTDQQSGILRARIKEQLGVGFIPLVLPQGFQAYEAAPAIESCNADLAGVLASQREEIAYYFGVPATLLRRDPAGTVKRMPPETTTSPSGAAVQHVDVPLMEDAPVPYVWLTRGQTTEEQRLFAVGEDPTANPPKWAIALENLTPEQQKIAGKISEI